MQNYVAAVNVLVELYEKTSDTKNTWRNVITRISQLLPHLTIGEYYIVVILIKIIMFFLTFPKSDSGVLDDFW